MGFMVFKNFTSDLRH